MKKLGMKLHSRSGETIAETLVALLIAAIALTMLAGMITATANLVKTSENKMDEYYKKSWDLETISTATEPITLTIAEDTADGNIRFSETVNQFKNGIFQKTPVIAYVKPPEGGAGGGG